MARILSFGRRGADAKDIAQAKGRPSAKIDRDAVYAGLRGLRARDAREQAERAARDKKERDAKG